MYTYADIYLQLQSILAKSGLLSSRMYGNVTNLGPLDDHGLWFEGLLSVTI
jgi:hypothetical protein